jgi:acyl carrier protein
VEDSITIIRNAIMKVAPDAELDTVDIEDDLRDAIGLDSMDFLNVVIAIHDATGIDIPERDYPQLTSLASFERYVSSASAPG